jgi:hypothetical protein
LRQPVGQDVAGDPEPAWNSSKCWSPLSAPRRIRNAHFSPISSTAGGKRAAQRRFLERVDVRRDVAAGIQLPSRIASKHNRFKKQLQVET